MAKKIVHQVLLVEDDADVNNLLCAFIQSQGLQVHSAANGQEALQLINKNPIDIVTLDLNLADMGGLELLYYLKKNNRDIKVIISSGSSSLEAEHCLRRGALEVLSKPLKLQELKVKLDQLVRERRTSKRFKSRGLFCRVRNDSRQSIAEGILNDVSLDGALIGTVKDIRKVKKVYLEFTDIRSSDTVAKVAGEVVRKMKNGGEVPHQFAVHFDPSRNVDIMERLIPYTFIGM